MNKELDNVEWVKVRAACSAEQMFEKLKLDVQHDIGLRNKLLEDHESGFPFMFSESAEGFTVSRERVGGSSVSFIYNGVGILVKHRGKVLFTATVTLNDEGDCRFKVNGEERTSWQLRKMALEELFFTPLGR